MGSEISNPVEVQSTLEEKMREKALQKRGESVSASLKISDLQRRMLGALCKGDRKRLLTGNNFDAIVPDDKSKDQSIYHDGLVMILCHDREHNMKIKSFLEKLFPRLTEARYPEFTMRPDLESITESVKVNMRRRVIGYTDFFVFYAVVPDRFADNIEREVKETVDYFLKRHKGALRNVPSLFIFESGGPMDTLLPLALEDYDDVTVVVTDGKNSYKTLREGGKSVVFGSKDSDMQPAAQENELMMAEVFNSNT